MRDEPRSNHHPVAAARARTLAAVVLVFVAAVFSLSSCASGGQSGGPSGRGSAGDGGATLRVFATGDAQGFLGPCGCDDAQFGGIARRGSYLAAATRKGDLLVDLGNVAAGQGGLPELRLRTLFEALDAMEYQVFVPGALEVLLGDRTRSAAEGRSVRVVSANVVDRSGLRVFDAWVLHDLGDGRRVAVVGVTAETDGESWRALPPEAAATSAILDARARAEFVIVAAAMPVSDAVALANRLPEVAVVVAFGPPLTRMTALSAEGHHTDPADDGFRAARSSVAVAGEFAAYVRRIDLGVDLKPVKTWRGWLGEDISDNPDMAALYARYRQEVSLLDPDLIPDILAGLSARGFAGSHACTDCHRQEYDIWKASLHGRAMKILVEKESARDPDCVACHLVDVPESLPENLPVRLEVADELGVGCEACHGGRAEHILRAESGELAGAPPPPFSARDVCTGCHHPPEVKSFDFDTHWPRIAHGRGARSVPRPTRK